MVGAQTMDREDRRAGSARRRQIGDRHARPRRRGRPDGRHLPRGDAERRIVFTNAIDGDWTPRSPQPVQIVGYFQFTDLGNGKTGYRAGARHWTAEAMEQHRAMGFAEGWGICAGQLEAVAKRLAETEGA